MTKKVKYGYICGTDWFHELGNTKVFVFHSIAELKATIDCWKDCGIVKLKIQEEEWVQEPKPIDEWEKEETCETSC